MIVSSGFHLILFLETILDSVFNKFMIHTIQREEFIQYSRRVGVKIDITIKFDFKSELNH